MSHTNNLKLIIEIKIAFYLDRNTTMSEQNQKIPKMKKFIHVTGFGPFRGFTEMNPSWEAVSRLPDEICVNHVNYTIKKHNVSVTYESVNDIVPKLWASKPAVSEKMKKKIRISMKSV